MTLIHVALTLSLCVLGSLAVQAAGKNPALTTPELLIDLARDYAVGQSAAPTQADVQYVQTLLRAALRLQRKLPDAYAYLYEFANLQQQPAEAAQMLQALLNCEPAHQGAFARWIEMGAAAQQTIEKRRAWLGQVISAVNRPPEIEAIAHAALARLSLQSLDRVAARSELQKALTLDPYNPDAAELVLGLIHEGSTPADRLRAAWRALRLNPFGHDELWTVAMILQEAGLSEEAGALFDDWFAVHRARELEPTLPAEHRLAYIRNLLAREQLAAAERACEAIIADSPLHAAEAGILLHYILVRQERAEEAAAVRTELAKRFEPIRDPAEWPTSELAQAAWFHCLVDPQAQRALMLAEAAAARAPEDPFLRRVLGFAQAANFQVEAARQTLGRISRTDPYAAYALARLARDSGDDTSAREILSGLTVALLPGPAAELVRSLNLGDLRPAAALAATSTELRKTLAGLDRTVFEFGKAPEMFLAAELVMDDPSPAAGEPWWATLTLKNTGNFAITLGADRMVNPLFLLSFTLEGDRPREFPTQLSISIDRVRVLPPGASVSVRRTLDIGPLRRISRQTPQQIQRVGVTALLDPIRRSDGVWSPALGGQRLATVYFNRLPVRVDNAAMDGLFEQLNSPVDATRYQALDVLASLLGEAQRSTLSRLSYRPQPIPFERIVEALLKALASDNWEDRVRALDAIAIVGLDQRMLAAVEDCLAHPHWLVRLMSLRVVSRRGAAAREAFESIRQRDADPLVRDLAACYLAGWQPTTDTAPADSSHTVTGSQQP